MNQRGIPIADTELDLKPKKTNEASSENTNIAESIQHDTAYKAMLQHKETVISFIRLFLPPEIVQDMNFKDMVQISGQNVTTSGNQLIEDAVWRIRKKDTYCFIFVMFECQSSNDYSMALRCCQYSAELLGRLNAENPITIENPLPLILSMVIYNGRVKWTAPLCFSELQGKVSEQWKEFQPQFKYALIDIRRAIIRTRGKKEIAALIIRLEQAQSQQDALEVMRILLKFPADAGISRYMLLFLKYILPHRTEFTFNTIQTSNLKELYNMAEHDELTWKQYDSMKLQEKARAEGEAKGRAEGEEKGGREMILTMVRNIMKQTGKGLQEVMNMLFLTPDQKAFAASLC